MVHPDNPLNVSTFTNGGELETEGYEFEFKSTPVENLILLGTYTYFVDGDELLVPPSFASLIANYTYDKFNFND